jgi:hypothetical protein
MSIIGLFRRRTLIAGGLSLMVLSPAIAFATVVSIPSTGTTLACPIGEVTDPVVHGECVPRSVGNGPEMYNPAPGNIGLAGSPCEQQSSSFTPDGTPAAPALCP